MKSLALENCDCNSSEIAYMGTFVPVFACSFYVGHVFEYSSLGGRRLALIHDYGNNWSFLYVCFYKITIASLYTYLSVYC